MLGVWITGGVKPQLMQRLWSLAYKPSGEVAKLLDEVSAMNEKVAGEGLRAIPLRPSQLAFLMHRSCAPGVPAPVHSGKAGRNWGAEDVVAFSDPVEWYHTPLGRTVEVVADYGGRTRPPARGRGESGPDAGPPSSLRTGRIRGCSRPRSWPSRSSGRLSGRMLKQTELAETTEFEQNRASTSPTTTPSTTS